MQFQENTTIQDKSELVNYYQAKSSPDLRLGIEWERSGVYRDSLEPVQYLGNCGYLAILKKLVAEAGWKIIDGHRNQIYELQRGNARVTIEADGRLELAGSAKLNLHDLAREFRIHANEVREVSDFFGVSWLPIGRQPFHKNSEIKLLKKKRYQLFMKLGDKKWMESNLKRNNGLTTNFSYLDEANAIKKAQIAFRILPIMGAMFASSPLDLGKSTEFLNLRRRSIFKYLPGLNEMPSNILDSDFSFQKWIHNFIESLFFNTNSFGKFFKIF
jgi:glutamate--cysteine ligase